MWFLSYIFQSFSYELYINFISAGNQLNALQRSPTSPLPFTLQMQLSANPSLREPLMEPACGITSETRAIIYTKNPQLSLTAHLDKVILEPANQPVVSISHR